MKINILLFLFTLNYQLLPAQSYDFDLLHRDWYAWDVADKDFKAGDTLYFDTLQSNKKISKNYIQWEFRNNGDLVNFIADGTKPHAVATGVLTILSYDNLKWRLEKESSTIIIVQSYEARYKILELSKSKLVLRKMNELQCKIIEIKN